MELGAFAETLVPAGAIEEGFVKNQDVLRDVLAGIRKKYHLQYVNVSLPEEKAYLFTIELPFIEPKDIRSALSFKIEENVPVKLPDAVFDYYYVRPPNRAEGSIRLGVAVTHTKVVTSYTEAVIQAGLIPLSLEVESQAVARAIIPSVANSKPTAHIVVAMRESKTIFAIVAQGLVRFSSTLGVGGDSVVSSIEKSFSVDRTEAEQIRHGKETRERDELLFSLVNAASVVRDEVQRLLAYWDTHGDPECPTISDVVISGSDALLGLNDYLGRSFDMPVRLANVWTNIRPLEEYLPAMTYRESLDFAPALGLALSYD